MMTRCLVITYPVLAVVSNRYPRDLGRLPTCYSPVRHWFLKKASFLDSSVRLACIRHAASVHPEPGSNSPFDCLFSSFITLCFQASFLFLSGRLASFFLNWRFLFSFQRSSLLSASARLYYHLFFLSSTTFLHFFIFFLIFLKNITKIALFQLILLLRAIFLPVILFFEAEMLQSKRCFFPFFV